MNFDKLANLIKDLRDDLLNDNLPKNLIEERFEKALNKIDDLDNEYWEIKHCLNKISENINDILIRMSNNERE